VQACAAARADGATTPGLIAVALFPTVHLLRDRHGLVMDTYGREPASLNNVAGLGGKPMDSKAVDKMLKLAETSTFTPHRSQTQSRRTEFGALPRPEPGSLSSRLTRNTQAGS